jgi:hypothetical protein
VNFDFIYDGWLEQVWVRGSHGWEEVSLQREIGASVEAEIARRKVRNASGMRNG